MSALPPPPTRSAPVSRTTTPATQPTWKDRMKATGLRWGKAASDKAVQVNDYVGPKVNTFAENKFGTHAFWPVSGDFPAEMDKAAAILKEFTVTGVQQTDKKSKRKVLRKVPPSVLKKAHGLAIFTSMRSGIAPFGGAGGAGVVVARLENGSWSAPASISPQNLSTGFLIGIDVYDCILVIRTKKAMESFYSHKVTLGAEIAVAAGPYGAGASAEAGKEAAPIFSYVKSRGMYAGVEVVGQIFASRFDENAAVYNWPGIKAGDILTGKVKVPREAAGLIAALEDAASGRAQVRKGSQLDVPVDELAQTIVLEDGEVLKLPPTPDQTNGHEQESDEETEVVIRRSAPPKLPPRRQNNSCPPPLPPRNPRRSLEADMIGGEGSASVGTSPRVSAPPLPPRSTPRPESMVIAPTALAFSMSPTSPISPVSKLESIASLSVPKDDPPSYEQSESPLASTSALTDVDLIDHSPVHTAILTPPEETAPGLLVPPAHSPASAALSSASPASVYDDTPLSEIADLNLDALEADAPCTSALALPAHLTSPPIESPALTVPGEKYSLGPSPSSTRLSSYRADAHVGTPAEVALPSEEMSESERREWEQHFEEERKAAESAKANEAKKIDDESLLIVERQWCIGRKVAVEVSAISACYPASTAISRGTTSQSFLVLPLQFFPPQPINLSPQLQNEAPPPPGWPPGVAYLVRSRLSPSFPPELVPLLYSSLPSASPVKKYTSRPTPHPPLLAIKVINDTKHPAHGQRSLAARKRLETKTLLIPYLGVLHADFVDDQGRKVDKEGRPTKTEHEDSDYDLSLVRLSASDVRNPYHQPEEDQAVTRDRDRDRDPTHPVQAGDEAGEVKRSLHVSIGVDAARAGNAARFVNDYRGIGNAPNAEFKLGRGEAGEVRMEVWSTRRIEKGDEVLVSYGKGWWGARKG